MNQTVANALMLLVFGGALLALTVPLGRFMARLFAGERTLLHPVLRPVERGIYRLTGVDEEREQGWQGYAAALIVFSFCSWLLLYLLQRLQGGLPWNPAALPAVEERLAFNTAVSFVTNTNWQSYVPETTVSWLTQTVGLTVQNFLSAAVGIAVAVAFVRGFARRSAATLGNFWVDLTRATLYLLLPISVVATLVMVASGVPQALPGMAEWTTVGGERQRVALGPIASQEAIKILGTNGGGIFNVNSAHPYENPTAFTTLLQVVLIFAIPAALTHTFGRMVGNPRQGWAIFATMAALFVTGLVVAAVAEQAGNPLVAAVGADQGSAIGGLAAPGGNWRARRLASGSSPRPSSP